MPTGEYADFVKDVESSLSLSAKRSFEPFSQSFVDGGHIHNSYATLWDDPERRGRLAHRTPLQIERDRILYSRGMRKLTEKYHVIYRGNRRIIRNFTTHTLRMAQVTRAICGALRLNPDFAEAVALGAKIGAPPFVHASKSVLSRWIGQKLDALDRQAREPFSSSKVTQRLLFGNLSVNSTIPLWLAEKTPALVDKIKRYMPWAAGLDLDQPFSSGSQGYWSLATNPYILKSRVQRYSPETMFGIWRHSLDLKHGRDSFFHRFEIDDAANEFHQINWTHVTYESLVCQYSDDITWVIENLDDANSASLLAGGDPVYSEILTELRAKDSKVPLELQNALMDRDSGSLYNYFITEFVRHSQNVLQKLNDGADYRLALREGSSDAMIGLSLEASDQLNKMKSFLKRRVFSEPRVSNRFQILESISKACLDLLYEGRPDALEGLVLDRCRIQNLTEEERDRALELMRDDVHRIQLVATIFSDMSDQEIYDFVGIQGL